MEPPQFYTETLINNAFAFESPDQWGCQVTHYGFGHSEMGIEVSNGQDIRRYVHFSMVHYFSGTLKWMGANFQLHPWEDSLLLLQGLGLLTNFGSAPPGNSKTNHRDDVQAIHYQGNTSKGGNPNSCSHRNSAPGIKTSEAIQLRKFLLVLQYSSRCEFHDLILGLHRPAPACHPASAGRGPRTGTCAGRV